MAAFFAAKKQSSVFVDAGNIADSFNYSPTLAAPWVGGLSNAPVSTGTLSFSNTTSAVFRDLATADFALSFSINLAASSGLRIFFRLFEASTSGYGFELNLNSSSNCSLTFRTLAIGTRPALAAGNHTVLITCNKEVITVAVDGSTLFDITSTYGWASRFFGFRKLSGTATVSNFSMTAINRNYEGWNLQVPTFTKFAGNPIVRSDLGAGSDIFPSNARFLHWHVIKASDYSIPSPPGAYLAYYSTDHENLANGRIYRAYANSLFGPWTDEGPIYSHAPGGQTETPTILPYNGSQIYLLTHNQGVPSNGLQTSFVSEGSASGLTFSNPIIAMPTLTTGDLWKRRGHTGYARYFAEKDGEVYMTTALGTPNSTLVSDAGTQGFPEISRIGLWKTSRANPTAPWTYLGELNVSWLGKYGAYIADSNSCGFTANGQRYWGVSLREKTASAPNGDIYVCKLNDDLTVKEGWVKLFDMTESWETRRECRLHFIYVEGSTAYLYYQVNQNRLGVATATV